MSKQRLSNREQLRKMLKGKEPGSVLSIELIATQAILAKSPEKAVSELIKLLSSVTQQASKHFIAEALGTTKDPRVIRPLLKAAADPQNETYRSNFIWPLDKHNV
ncbi:HEAT repeat domain-containing protein [Hymenobacter sp. H14-R3]|uniref:HEAT repeat domain-containing protein n=1 Tax=Hymenobacter sp. H14-R3 TaxID=3046308 RepID=UPI0024B8F345|nr:HEAT repeat domain-containing protein [Hymenobacter sp. H14-R3]MDJ0366372.1 HEAT repeat domain-containing protein [Hymenobacter sp. H14-R3]